MKLDDDTPTLNSETTTKNRQSAFLEAPQGPSTEEPREGSSVGAEETKTLSDCLSNADVKDEGSNSNENFNNLLDRSTDTFRKNTEVSILEGSSKNLSQGVTSEGLEESSVDVATTIVEKGEVPINVGDPNALFDTIQKEIQNRFFCHQNNENWYTSHDFCPLILQPIPEKIFNKTVWELFKKACRRLHKPISDSCYRGILKTLVHENSVFLSPPCGESVALSDGYIVNLSNGEIDGRVSTYTDYFLPIHHTEWLRPSSTPLWDEFLRSHANKEDAELLELFIGYALSGRPINDYSCLLIIFGPPDTGKTQIIKFLHQLLPVYTVSVSVQDCMHNPLIAANIVGKRIATSSETVIRAKEAAKFRAIISGEDIKVKYLYRGEKNVSHNLVFVSAMNEIGWLDNVPENAKRVRAIEWKNPVSKDKMRPNFFKELELEKDGIIVKCLKRFLAYKDLRLPETKSSIHYMEEAGRNINPVSDWAHGRGIKGGTHFVTTQVLRDWFVGDVSKHMDVHEFSRKFNQFIGPLFKAKRSVNGIEQRGYLLNIPMGSEP